jgi:hypothetical protein
MVVFITMYDRNNIHQYICLRSMCPTEISVFLDATCNRYNITNKYTKSDNTQRKNKVKKKRER